MFHSIDRPTTYRFIKHSNCSSSYCHNSVEQKLVVKTPSCATNVSDHSSVGLFRTLLACKVCRRDNPREIELLLRRSCALAPILRTPVWTGSIFNDILLSVPFALEGSILNVPTAEEDDAAELLLLLHGDLDVQCFSSITSKNVEKFPHG